MNIHEAEAIIRASRRERWYAGPDWFRVSKNSNLLELDGCFSREDIAALFTLMDAGVDCDVFDPQFDRNHV